VLGFWPAKSFLGLVNFEDPGLNQAAEFCRFPHYRFCEHFAGIESGFGWTEARPRLFFLGHCDLSNGNALGRALGCESSGGGSNFSLILHAYARWGTEMPKVLAGRYSFSIWDAQRRELFACRDHLGSLPFVYHRTPSCFAFAGDMQSMLEGFRIHRVLNLETLAATRFVGACQVETGATLFAGICSLPPGHWLVARRDHLEVAAYWQPEIHADLLPVRKEDVFAQTAELVENAVSRWVTSSKSPSLAFSGGLDSSVLAVVLSKCLRKSNRTFLALGAVNQVDNSDLPDERTFMAELSGLDNMELRYVPAVGRGPFDGIDDPSLFHTSCIRYSRRFLLDEVTSVAQGNGADMLLSGDWGEHTISESPSPYLLQSALQLRFPSLLSTLRSKRQLSGISEARLLASEAKHYWWRPRPRTETHFFSPSFIRAFPGRLFPRYPFWPATQKKQLQDVQRALALDGLMSTRPRESVFFHASPFRDPELLEFCLAVPAHFKSRNGIRRYLAKRSFEHMLPRSLAWRATKLPYSPDYHLRYNEQLPKAIEFINGIRKSDPVHDVVDVDRLRSLAKPVGGEASVSYSAALGPVPRTIYLINFLRQFPAFTS